ncbi:hypothetical protein [Fastidiosibacter lacustris]|uniref:hypothetical protein n=1 Tax=Fastidiosibacter lacustris TaxID=2056695 RepID=UPI000E34559C|nr:hypothetical protein [Fastidiosibacter lacustris]
MKPVNLILLGIFMTINPHFAEQQSTQIRITATVYIPTVTTEAQFVSKQNFHIMNKNQQRDGMYLTSEEDFWKLQLKDPAKLRLKAEPSLIKLSSHKNSPESPPTLPLIVTADGKDISQLGTELTQNTLHTIQIKTKSTTQSLKGVYRARIKMILEGLW